MIEGINAYFPAISNQTQKQDASSSTDFTKVLSSLLQQKDTAKTQQQDPLQDPSAENKKQSDNEAGKTPENLTPDQKLLIMM